jgi:hypothetical protein
MHADAMNLEAGPVRPRWRETGLALVVMLVSTLATAWLLHAGVKAHGSSLPAAGATAAGTVVMALLLARVSSYPRWSWFGAAGILAVSDLLGTLVFPLAEAWKEAIHPQVWMHPWLFMVLALVIPSRGTGICSTSSRWAGWMLIGIALLLGGIDFVTGWIGMLL